MLDIYEIATGRIISSYVIAAMILFGYLHKRIKDSENRKWVATGMGFINLIIVFGFHIWHLVAYVLLCLLIIQKIKYKGFHLIVTFVSISYISLFKLIYYEETKCLYNHMTLVQLALTAKIIGLAFDTNDSRNKKNDENGKEVVMDYVTNPNFMEQFHFSFCYIGIWAGIFYRYRTYDDFINRPFYALPNTKDFVLQRICKIAIILPLYLYLHGQLWPLHYIMSEEFQTRSILYKMMYGAFQLEAYTLSIFNMFIIGELTCCTAGLGAYPIQGKNKSGRGPTEEYKNIKEMSLDVASKQTYDYTTVLNLKMIEGLFTPWMFNYIRSWNITYQYWLTSIIYKNLNTRPETKRYAMLSTMVFSALWHGINPGFYVTFILLGLLSETNKIYWKIGQHISDWKSIPYQMCTWFLRKFFMGYVGISFLMYNWYYIHYYFSSVYYLPFVLHLIYHVIGKIILSNLKIKKISKD